MKNLTVKLSDNHLEVTGDNVNINCTRISSEDRYLITGEINHIYVNFYWRSRDVIIDDLVKHINKIKNK